MNRDYFLRELEYLLMDISEEERESALEYYTDYFDEAGPDRESEIAAKLGSPEKVAAEIRAGLAGDTDSGEFTECGYRDERFEENVNRPDKYAEVVVGEVVDENADEGRQKRRQNRRQKGCCGNRDTWQGGRYGEWKTWHSADGHRRAGSNGHRWADGTKHRDTDSDKYDEYNTDVQRRRRGSGILLLILFLIFGVPLAGTIISAGCSVVAAILGALIGIFGGLFGLIIGAVAMTFGLFISGIGMIFSGIFNMAAPALGIMTVGFGFFMLAGAFLLAAAAKWGCGTAVPGLFRFCMEMIRKFFGLIKRLFCRMFGRGGETR